MSGIGTIFRPGHKALIAYLTVGYPSLELTERAVTVLAENGADLVEVAPNAVPPVCRILDYGKYKYQQDKKEREIKKGQKLAVLREVRLRPKIGIHDLESKIRTIKKINKKTGGV